MARALDEYIVEGIKTTIPFHKRIMANKDFIEGNIDTSFLERIVLE
jgi:acetyl-CoA carboxylase biotin carboxylase subunit